MWLSLNISGCNKGQEERRKGEEGQGKEGGNDNDNDNSNDIIELDDYLVYICIDYFLLLLLLLLLF